MLVEHLDHRPGEMERATTPLRLEIVEVNTIGVSDQLTPNVEDDCAFGRIDVFPLEAEDLTASKPEGQCENVRRRQPVLAGCEEEHPSLLRRE